MSWRREFSRLRALFHRPKLADDLKAEIRAHIAIEEQENLEAGMPPEEAHYSALRRFGNVALAEERSREMWIWNTVETLLQDLRYGLRQLRRNPGFTAVAVITLALGIGANTAIFSVVNGVLLNPLPVPHSERLVRIWEGVIDKPGFTGSVSFVNFKAWREQNTTFRGLSAEQDGSFNLSGKGSPVHVDGAYVSANFFKVIGVDPLLGRGFDEGEDQPGHNQVVVISNSLWRSEFGSDPAIIGKTIEMNESPVTVVGVAADRFPFPSSDAQVWTPLAPTGMCSTSPGCDMYEVFGRLKPGTTLSAADAQMNTIMARLRKQYPNGDAERTAKMLPLRQSIVGGVRLALYVFIAAVGFVFLIALANVANLLLARTSARQREFSLRLALGAGRLRLFRQFLTETLLLAVTGAALGWLVADWGVRLLQTLKPSNVPRLTDVHPDARVLVFTIGVTVAAAVVLGAAATTKALRFGIQENLKEAGPSTSAGLKRQRSRGVLVVAEIAISLILLTGAGLLIVSFWRIEQVQYGLDPENILTMRISLSASIYGQQHPVSSFFYPLLEKVRALPGVRAAGINSLLPIQESWINGDFEIQGHSYTAANAPEAEIRAASAGFNRALGIPVLRGRFFFDSDAKGSPPVVIINQALARQYFPKEDPIGQHLEVGGEAPWYTVVGVAGNVKQAGYGVPASPEIDIPYAQWPPSWPDLTRDMTMAVRTSADPKAMANSVLQVVHSLDPKQPVFEVRTMRQVIANSIAEPRFNVLLLGIFAALALVLAAIGIYGVLAYSVRQRTHEIGIRMALGAQKSDVLKMVAGQGLRLAIIGVIIGIAGALALTRFLSSLLYDVKPTDPFTFVAVSLIFIAVALLACYIPARRAAKVDPMVALRHE